MALDGTSVPNRLNDIADTLDACDREKVCGRSLPQTIVPLLAEAEDLGAFAGPEYAAVRLALARWRNPGTEPWNEVVGQYAETDPSVITYQAIVSALFPDLADTDEEEKVGKCELHLWQNWADAAPQIAEKIRLAPKAPTAKDEESEGTGGSTKPLRGGDREAKLLTFLRELAAYEKAVRNARELEFFRLEAGHSLHDAVESLGALPSPEPQGTWLELRNRSRPRKTVTGWENRQKDILLKDIPALRAWGEDEVEKCQRNPAETHETEQRFRIALSFAGERRVFVEKVANYLAASVERKRVLYDRYHEAEFARANLDTHLQELYHEQSELIAVFLCADYERKEWCGLELRAIRDLIKRRHSSCVMFLRFDDTEISGIFSTDGYVWIGNRTADVVGELILERLKINAENDSATGGSASISQAGIPPQTVAPGNIAADTAQVASTPPTSDEYEDGTNVPRGTPFFVQVSRTTDWYRPAESKSFAEWNERWARLRTRFEQIVDECRPIACALIEKRIPEYPTTADWSQDILAGRELVQGGGGLRCEPSFLFAQDSSPLFGVFPIRDVKGMPMSNAAGEAFGFRFGLFRQFLVHSERNELQEGRALPGRRLFELARDGTALLYQLPANVATSLWRNWQSGFSRRTHSDEYLWLDALFELSWQRKPGDVLHTKRYAWFGGMSIELEGKGLFPRLPDLSLLPGSISIPEDNGYPVVWRSTLPDVARASVIAIDELLERAR